MKFNLIDIEHWTRKPYFEHYLNSVRCTYSMTANIEITNLLHDIKLKKLKLYPTLIYIIATVVNNHKEFRTCFDENGNLGYWDSMSPSYTIFHKDNETFSSIWTEYDENFPCFYSKYFDDIKNYGDIMRFTPKLNEPANTFPISCIPWVSFTGFNLNIYNDGRYLVPIFTIGKYFEQNNKIFIPMSIQVHHAVCDGYYTSRFINEVQELAVNSQTWLRHK
ncbi:type A chloramphenicol O-acetyltransferase [Clostridium sp. CX1]|uniref:type A chloramphenicol O-acetyltransferase n=1 Tax=Clostridium sp. CX1 TaxID=2978346 RepID=UPI0021BFD16A|nr:type A chloramphenicol O-acetyltransferase [Clostridium sp. CX1]MCT8975160.1 type A chloramphenicol O-acetyltransferase [Clostridium sp. CX1]